MSEDISQLFNTFKDILQTNSSNTSNTSSSTPNHSEINITPEMISSLAEKLNNTTSSNNSDSNSSQSQSYSSSTSNNPESNSQIDFETILKIKSIIEKFNQKDDPRSNLLNSLKPYLRESRQKKIDEYANLLKFTSISDLFKNN